MTRSVAAVLLGLLSVAASAQHPAAPAPDPLEPAGTGGVATVQRALAKLSTHKRLLVIGAHPDDEDTSLLTLVAAGMGGEAAYLSLSRGDGGQNLIGPELGVGLGLLRTGELMSARRIEGGRQFFTRAYDFGYTRSLDETFVRWPRAVLREDAVRVVRRFMPQVIVSVFPADGRGGHGQHQAAGHVAHELIELAADQGGELPPWKVSALYRKTWWDPESATMQESLGVIEPFSGRSIRQLASASRSRHRSQDMGRPQELGGADATAAWVAGEAGENGDRLFAGIDTRLAAMALPLADEALRSRVAFKLVNVETAARAALRDLTPSAPGSAAPAMRRAITLLDETRALLEEVAGGPEAAAIAALVREKKAVAEVGLAAALGLALDASVETERVAAGTSLPVTVELWNSGGQAVEIEGIRWEAADGWSMGGAEPVVEEGEEVPADGVLLATGELRRWAAPAMLSSDAEPSVPYFLRSPLDGDLYDWSAVPAEWRGEPFEPPVLTAVLDLVSDGVRFSLRREVVQRSVVQEIGEVRRPIQTVPRLEVGVSPSRMLWRADSGNQRSVTVSVRSNVAEVSEGVIRVRPPAGWPVPAEVPFEVGALDNVTVEIPVERPEHATSGHVSFEFEAVTADEATYSGSYPMLDYEHVRPRLLPQPSRVDVSVLDLALPDVDRVGYLRGASDRVPEALIEMGLDVELLDPEELMTSNGTLDAFDAIIVGPRAYETDPAVGRANGRLLEFARRGGLLLVQYQQYQFVRGEFPPLALDIARPHGRVTDETAAMTLLEPSHPVFTMPNKLSAADWDGWVQERGLYFADTWDDGYRALLELADDGQPAQRGGLLIAELGEGTYVYTGLAFFRQLPVGVPGAARLFANLIALAEVEP